MSFPDEFFIMRETITGIYYIKKNTVKIVTKGTKKRNISPTAEKAAEKAAEKVEVKVEGRPGGQALRLQQSQWGNERLQPW